MNQEPRQCPKSHRVLTPKKSAKACDSNIDNLRLTGFDQPANRLPLDHCFYRLAIKRIGFLHAWFSVFSLFEGSESIISELSVSLITAF